MGDRGNIVVQEAEGKRVYLYTHWHGSDITDIAKKAMRRNIRWNDPAYLARIIFDAMTEGQQGQETGYGISSTIVDNEHPILVLDCEAQVVQYESPEGKPRGKPSHSICSSNNR